MRNRFEDSWLDLAWLKLEPIAMPCLALFECQSIKHDPRRGSEAVNAIGMNLTSFGRVAKSWQIVHANRLVRAP
jgi:hypothetical protein